MRTVAVTRYVTPLREGGSVPAIVEADDDGTYVLKLRGAAQGPKALVAELVAGRIAQVLGLPMPELVLAEVDPLLARSEPDPEIQEPLKASAGLNLALDFLPGALAFDAARASPAVELASKIVWFDAYVANVDRTAKNTNLLVWGRKIQLIDHGAALYYQHDWPRFLERATSRFPQIAEHVLLRWASELERVDGELAARLDRTTLAAIVDDIPDAWLETVGSSEARRVYLEFLLRRLEAPRLFVEEAVRARAQYV